MKGKKKPRIVISRKQIEAAKEEVIKSKYRCFYCKHHYLETEDELNEHHLLAHGRVTEQEHKDAPDGIDHRIYMKYYKDREAKW